MATASTSYSHAYTLARQFASIDHISNGRVAWNIVTSYLPNAARNFGLGEEVDHDHRYEIADEYLDVLYKLWEGSWEDDAVVLDIDQGIYADPEKVHPIAHEGTYYKVPGIHMTEPSPQRTQPRQVSAPGSVNDAARANIVPGLRVISAPALTTARV